MADRDARHFDHAFRALQRQMPPRLARPMAWLHSSRGRWARLVVGAALILQTPFWFLPVLGLEFLPLGLLLIAQDIPPLRKPVARAVLWMVLRWMKLKRWRRMR